MMKLMSTIFSCHVQGAKALILLIFPFISTNPQQDGVLEIFVIVAFNPPHPL